MFTLSATLSALTVMQGEVVSIEGEARGGLLGPPETRLWAPHLGGAASPLPLRICFAVDSTTAGTPGRTRTPAGPGVCPALQGP